MIKTNLPYFVKQESDGRYVYKLDSSMLGAFSRCPRLFYYQYVQLYRRKGMPVAMTIGGWWSRVLELFYLNMQQRQLANAGYVTLDEMIEFAADAWTVCMTCKHQHSGSGNLDPCNDCDCTINRNMNMLKDQNPKGWDQFGGAKGAIVMAKEYYDKIGLLDNNNLKIVASEAGFGLKGEIVLYEDSSIIVHYVGKPDLIVFDKNSNFLAPLDHKSIDRVRSDIQRKYKPHSQTTGYIFAVGHLARDLGYDIPVDRCIINVCGRLMPAEKPRDGKIKPRFTRVYPNYSAVEVEEWRLSAIEKVKQMHSCLVSETDNGWYMNDNSCHLYGGCDFRIVDSVPFGSRNIILNADFVKTEPWIPYEVEEPEEDFV